MSVLSTPAVGDKRPPAPLEGRPVKQAKQDITPSILDKISELQNDIQGEKKSLGDRAQAIEQRGQTQSKEPSTVLTVYAKRHFKLASNALKQNNPLEAEKFYSEVLTFPPNFSPHELSIKSGALWGLGLAALRRQNYEAAQKYFNDVIILGIHDVIAHENLGTIALAQGKLQEAEKEFKEALKLNPRHRPSKDGLKKIAEIRSDDEITVKEEPL